MAEPRANASSAWNGSAGFSGPKDADVAAHGSPALRVLVSAAYSLVCAAGLLGNLLVFLLMKTRRGGSARSSISAFILNLAVTDFQFVLTLPFWAADTALDFSWPFGAAMCTIVLSVTVMNMYASVFFLTAMSVTRYWAVAAALTRRGRRRLCPVRWAIAALWAAAALASLPTAVFSTVRRVAGERLCLLAFPEGAPWLALYHLQKLLLAFLLPLLVLAVCYLRLLRAVRVRSTSASRARRSSRVTRAVTVLVLSFFVCWMPNHAVTFWGVLVKFDLLRFDRNYYLAHTYVHPLSVCLAHANSCLNPLLYCLLRRDFRRRMRELLRGVSAPRGAGAWRAERHVATPLKRAETEKGGMTEQ